MARGDGGRSDLPEPGLGRGDLDPRAALAMRGFRICVAIPALADGCHPDLVVQPMLDLAAWLARAGSKVTVLTAGNIAADRLAAGAGLNLVAMPRPRVPAIGGPQGMVDSYHFLRWLEALPSPMDCVIFLDRGGLGFYPTLAKHQGLSLADTKFISRVSGPLRWEAESGAKLGHLWSVDDLAMDFMESESARLADCVFFADAAIAEWVTGAGRKVPAKSVILADPPPHSIMVDAAVGGRGSELRVLSGLADAAQLRLILRAITESRLAQDSGWRVDFVGTPVGMDLRTLRQRLMGAATAWKCDWNLASWRWPGVADGRPAAVVLPHSRPGTRVLLNRLAGRGTVLVLPARREYTEQMPSGGRTALCWEGYPASLAEALDKAANGAAYNGMGLGQDPARGAAWISEIRRVVTGGAQHVKPPIPMNFPLVTICIPHHERPGLLDECLESVRRQDYPAIEVVVVDDGSRSAGAVEALARLERSEDFVAKGWRLLRQANRYPAAARNRAAREAHGEYLFFLDDDNILKADAISTLVAVALRTNADVHTCALSVFTGKPPAENCDDWIWLCLGPAVAASCFHNFLGDQAMLVRRSYFVEHGGLTEDYAMSCEDQEFLGKAALSGGRLEFLAKPLVYYRVQSGSVDRSTDTFANRMRALRPYLAALPPEFSGILLAAVGASSRDPDWGQLTRKKIKGFLRPWYNRLRECHRRIMHYL